MSSRHVIIDICKMITVRVEMDRLGCIIAFVRTAELGSFAGAGGTLGVHGSAVSKSVARLEDYLSVRLFHRNTRALSLTEEGRIFHARCAKILDDLEDAEVTMSQKSRTLQGRLTVSLPVALGRLHLAPALADFMAEHPALKITTVLSDSKVDLVNEGYDVVVRIGTPADSSLVGRRLAQIQKIVCAAPSYLASCGTPETLDDLTQHRCVTFARSPSARPSPWRFADPDRLGSSIDVAVGGPLQINNSEAILDAAVAGVGLVQLHSYLAIPAITSGTLVPVLQDLASTDGPPVYALYPSARQISPKVRAFVDLVAGLLSPVPVWERGQLEPERS